MKRWLVTALLVLVLAASAVAAFGLWGIAVTAYLLVLLVGVHLWRMGKDAGRRILFLCFIVLLLFLIFAPAFSVDHNVGETQHELP